MSKFAALQYKACLGLLIIAGVTLCSMLVFTLVNVVLRGFDRPVAGDFEVISFLGAIVVGFSMPYVALTKGHVAVDLLPEKLSKRSSGTLQACTRLAGVGLFGVMGSYFAIMGRDLLKSGEVTPMLRVPYFPIGFSLAFCCFLVCAILLTEAMKAMGKCHE